MLKRTHPKPIGISVYMSIIADYTTSSIPHGILFQSENCIPIEPYIGSFFIPIELFSISNRIRGVHVNAAVYRSHRSHGNVKIHTVAQIHTSVLSIRLYLTSPSTLTNSSELAKRFCSKPAGYIQFVSANAPRDIIDITQVLLAT